MSLKDEITGLVKAVIPEVTSEDDIQRFIKVWVEAAAATTAPFIAPNRISPIPISNARSEEDVRIPGHKLQTVLFILNHLAKEGWTIKDALGVLDNTKDAILSCTRLEKFYLMDWCDREKTTNPEDVR